MSAFICCNEHISAIVGWYAVVGKPKTWGGKQLSIEETQALGQKLLDENYRSVNHRYNESETPETFELVHEFVSCPVDPIMVIKACHCLDYQSCETDDWPTTEARKLLTEIESAATRALPGYEEAPWEITEHPTKTRQPAVSTNRG